ncbi:NXPE family member 3-like isoform X2 [Gambusia affinis]|uniref:NXPE family member 3-like isoform X2 n=1 Tax=Gambusia affinis TaxID=33528 RepID=UPI001CDC8AC7|nr:NXPE family member 3-like isoform X2 [Gambusia affinis]
MEIKAKSGMKTLLLNEGRASRNRCLMKRSFILLFVVSSGVLFVLYYMDFSDQSRCRSGGKLCIFRKITYVTPTKLAPEPNTISPLRPTEPASTCSFHSASPENAAEVNLLKESIAWPETPSVPPDFSLNDTSDPAHSTFTILPRRGGGSWHVGDQLEVLIKISDFHGRPRKTGGDLFYARLQNRAVFAGAAGKVLDHRNGSYTAVFSLLWDGNAEVEVSLVHPSEAITVLAKVTQEYPDRAYFLSVFRSGSITETVRCNVCLKGPKEKLCNYTDLHTGEPWFCYKPKKLTCDNRITHSKGGFSFKPESKENQLFQRGVNMKVSIPSFGPSSIKILPKLKDGTNEIVKTNPAGYYYQGAWQALDGTTVRQFNNASARTQCLKGKVVHLYGDSTVRQFFEFLIENTPDLKIFDLKSPGKAGPYMALDHKNNILLTYRCHGTPILYTPMLAIETRHIATELRTVAGGPDTVIVISVWAHFTSFPIEVYIRRLLNIKRAVVELLTRAPGTLVIIRTSNPKESVLREIWTSSDWYALQCYKVLREIFKGVNVQLLDAWEMCLAHQLPHSLHPQTPIVKNMIDVVLSHTCPLGGKSKGATKQ